MYVGIGVEYIQLFPEPTKHQIHLSFSMTAWMLSSGFPPELPAQEVDFEKSLSAELEARFCGNFLALLQNGPRIQL